MLRKPSITNCPAYVPVIVELCPAASRPMAQIYLEASPKVSERTTEAVFKSISISGLKLGPFLYAANVDMTAALIKNDINREKPLSIVLYMFASFI